MQSEQTTEKFPEPPGNQISESALGQLRKLYEISEVEKLKTEANENLKTKINESLKTEADETLKAEIDEPLKTEADEVLETEESIRLPVIIVNDREAPVNEDNEQRFEIEQVEMEEIAT